jgi:hypothetical protein
MLEKDVHSLICQYIRLKYPNLIFRTDFSSGMKMTIGMARRHKSLQSHSAYPDLFIAEPKGQYSGMYLELKSLKNKIFKADGTLLKNKHHEEQAEMLEKLRSKGYYAEFGLGYQDSINKINNYLAIN